MREAHIAKGAPAEVDIPEGTHWQAMAPVDKAIVFGFHSRHLGLIVPDDLVASYVKQHPEKLIGFACLDPHEPDYLDEMRRVFEDLKLRGLKLAPIYQNYHPMDERMQPVYEYCQKNHLPILFHQGTTFPEGAAEVRVSFAAGRCGSPLSGLGDRHRPHGTPLDGRDRGAHPETAERLCRHLGAVLPTLAVLQRLNKRRGVRGFAQASVRLRLPVYDACRFDGRVAKRQSRHREFRTPARSPRGY